MKVIIIDDEPIIRQGIIHKILRIGLPIDIVGEASDGITALQIIRSVEPQAIITDIQMPGMNGLEFIGQAKELCPELEFIIVSGFDHFDYARQAIRFGVNRYLLKPVEEEELYEALSELLEKLKTEENQAVNYSKLQALEKMSRETIRQQELTRYIQHGEVIAEDHELLELERNYRWLSTTVLQFKPFTMPHGSFAAGEESLLWYAVKNIIMEPFKEAGIRGVLVHHTSHYHELVYVIGLQRAEDRSLVTQVLEEILYGISKYMKLDVTIGVASFVDRLELIQACYREARQLTRNAMLHGTNRIYHMDAAMTKKLTRSSIISEEDEKMLYAWLKGWEADKIHHWTERRIGSIVQDPDSVYIQLEWFCVDLYLLFHKYLLAHSEASEWTIGEMDDLLQWLQQLSAWQEVVSQMKSLADNMIRHLSRTDGVAGKNIMEAVRVHIETNYHEHLSLQSISERFYIHPNYFSKRFKEKFGSNFIEYLTAIRMKQAASLLKESELKVHQIAERVGFEDAAYFSSVFRMTYGATPKQYRDQSIRT